MKKLEFRVLEQPQHPAALSSLAASITQHPIKSMDDLQSVFNMYKNEPATRTVKFCQSAKHNTQRHNAYTIAVVGGSRRLLAQIRTHHVGIEFTSASLQYQDVSAADFFIPYKIYEKCESQHSGYPLERFNQLCQDSLDAYKEVLEDTGDNDVAGYVINNSVRNVLLITGGAEAFRHLINRRICRRNTNETRYVALKIWEALLQTTDGEIMFGTAGADCMQRGCVEGKMTCKDPLPNCYGYENGSTGAQRVKSILRKDFPLMYDMVGEEK